MKRSALLAILSVLTILAAFPPAIVACQNCVYSPNNFGFCRYYQPSGSSSCSGYVADEFSGRTDCHLGAMNCTWNQAGGGSPGNGDCEFTNIDGTCLGDNDNSFGFS